MQDSADQDVIHALRTVHQYQMQLIIHADQKANILLGIVAVTSTILITNADFLSELSTGLLVPFAGFLLMEGLAILLALLVVLPKNAEPLKAIKIEDMPNPAFFGFFTQFAEEEYVAFLSSRVNDNRSARTLLITDLYQIGVVLARKYSRLKSAYITAATGFVFLLFFILGLIFIG
jgi:hypothetical protein